MDQSIKRRTIWPPAKDEKPRPAPFQHFKTEEERREHLKQVKEAQEKYNTPF